MKPSLLLVVLTSEIPHSEVSVAKLLGGLEEEPLADGRKVPVHSADCLDHLSWSKMILYKQSIKKKKYIYVLDRKKNCHVKP